MDPERRYWFPVVGYNYRMMNLPAAIGLAQLERADWHTGRRREVAEGYLNLLRGVPFLRWQERSEWARHAYWMFSVVLGRESRVDRDELMKRMHERGVETRPLFYPVHLLPPYQGAAGGEEFPVAEWMARRGLSLPTWAGLGADDLKYVCEVLRESLPDGPGA